MTYLTETSEHLRAQSDLESWIGIFLTTFGERRRTAAKQIRTLAITFPWLGDLIPTDVYETVYRVRAVGTAPPESTTKTLKAVKP